MKRYVIVLVAFLSLLALSSGSLQEENKKTSLRRRIFASEAYSTTPLVNQSDGTSVFHQSTVAEDSAMAWRELVGEESSMSIYEVSVDSCLPMNAAPFDTDGSVNFGPTNKKGIVKRKGNTTRCGSNCYELRGVGKKAMCTRNNNNVEATDRAHFAYTTVSSGPFTLVSQVCGTNSTGVSSRAGLMVRESLEPLAKNIFLSHTPDSIPLWSSRDITNGTTSFAGVATPIGNCVWLVLERIPSGDFVGFYVRDSDESDGVCTFEDVITPITFNGAGYPNEVYIGMAAMKGSYEFNDIHFAEGTEAPDLRL